MSARKSSDFLTSGIAAGGLELAHGRIRIGGLHLIQAQAHLHVRHGLDFREGLAVDDGVELLSVAEHDRVEGGVGRHDIQRRHRLGGQRWHGAAADSSNAATANRPKPKRHFSTS